MKAKQIDALLDANGFKACGHPDCDPKQPTCATDHMRAKARALVKAVLKSAALPPVSEASPWKWYANRADGGEDWRCLRCNRVTTFFGSSQRWCPRCDGQPPETDASPAKDPIADAVHADLAPEDVK